MSRSIRSWAGTAGAESASRQKDATSRFKSNLLGAKPRHGITGDFLGQTWKTLGVPRERLTSGTGACVTKGARSEKEERNLREPRGLRPAFSGILQSKPASAGGERRPS